MYNSIINPVTGRKCNINSKLGKKILAKYIYNSKIGGNNTQLEVSKPGLVFHTSDPHLLAYEKKLSHRELYENWSIYSDEDKKRILDSMTADEWVEFMEMMSKKDSQKRTEALSTGKNIEETEKNDSKLTYDDLKLYWKIAFSGNQ